MGRDAKVHGHNPGEPGNPNHGKHGQFSSGGGGGSSGGGSKGGGKSYDPKGGQKVAMAERAKLKGDDANKIYSQGIAKATTRLQKLAAARGDHQTASPGPHGHGYPVTSHAGQPSVGTGGSGGGGSSVGVGKGKGKPILKLTKGLRKSAQEHVAAGQAVDARHYGGGNDAATIARGMVENVPRGK